MEKSWPGFIVNTVLLPTGARRTASSLTDPRGQISLTVQLAIGCRQSFNASEGIPFPMMFVLIRNTTPGPLRKGGALAFLPKRAGR